jgi:hypothetical protein
VLRTSIWPVSLAILSINTRITGDQMLAFKPSDPVQLALFEKEPWGWGSAQPGLPIYQHRVGGCAGDLALRLVLFLAAVEKHFNRTAESAGQGATGHRPTNGGRCDGYLQSALPACRNR